MALIDPSARDNERRNMLAMAVLLGFFLIYTGIMRPEVPPPGPAATQPGPGGPLPPDTPEEPGPEAPPPERSRIPDRDRILLEDDHLQVRCTNLGAAVAVARLKDFAPPGRAELVGESTREAWNPFLQAVQQDPEQSEREVAPEDAADPDPAFLPGGLGALRLSLLVPHDSQVEHGNWRVVEEEKDRVVFERRAAGVTLRKTISLDQEPWPGTASLGPNRLKVEVTAIGERPGAQKVRLCLYGLSGSSVEGDTGRSAMYRVPQIGFQVQGREGIRVHDGPKVNEVKAHAKDHGGKPLVLAPEALNGAVESIDWLALGNHYFAGVLAPDPATRPLVRGLRFVPLTSTRALEQALAAASQGPSPLTSDEAAKLRDKHTTEVSGGLEFELALPGEGEARTATFHFYVGPRLKKLIEPMGLEALVRSVPICGVIQIGPFARLLTWCLVQINRLVGNFGWSIIILTLVIKIPLMPVNRANQISMAKYTAKMKKFGPRQKEIEAKYKGKTDAKSLQRKREETAQAMREAGITVPIPPGCLLMLIQMPIFVGLFSALQNSIELRHAPFILWIQDLSGPDQMFRLPFTVPFFGEYFNLLPVLMTLVWYLQSKLSMKLQDTGAMSEQQRMSMKMMAYMPIIFGVMFYKGASGLVLYWTVSTFISVIEFVVFRRAREAALEKAKASVNSGR